MDALIEQLCVAVECGGVLQKAAFAKAPAAGQHSPRESVGSNKVITSIQATAVERALMEIHHSPSTNQKVVNCGERPLSNAEVKGAEIETERQGEKSREQEQGQENL